MLKCLLRVWCARVGLARFGEVRQGSFDTRDRIQSTGSAISGAIRVREPGRTVRDLEAIVTAAVELDQARKVSGSGVAGKRIREGSGAEGEAGGRC
jgi:hypothetical protein